MHDFQPPVINLPPPLRVLYLTLLCRYLSMSANDYSQHNSIASYSGVCVCVSVLV